MTGPLKYTSQCFLSNNNLHDGGLDLGVGWHAQVVVAAPDGDGTLSPAEIVQVILIISESLKIKMIDNSLFNQK